MEEWYFGYLKNAFIPRYLLTLYRVHRVYHISFYSHFVQNKQSFITKKYSLYIGGLAKGIEKSRGMIENAMNGVTSDLTITPRVMAAQGSYSGSAASSGDLISGINTALNTALAGGGAAGDIVIPVYIGGDMIDEIVVTAQQRMNLRSGGR